jgi:hypothetical protein
VAPSAAGKVTSIPITAGSFVGTEKGLIGSDGWGAWNGTLASGSAKAGLTPSSRSTPAVTAVLPVIRKIRSTMSRRDIAPSS